MRNYLRATGAALVIAVIAALALAAPANAQSKSLVFENNTGRCAWVTLYAHDNSNPFKSPWSIIQGSARPTWVGPHSQKTFQPIDISSHPLGGIVDVRAEMQTTGACNGSGGPDIRTGFEYNSKTRILVRVITWKDRGGNEHFKLMW